MDVKYFADLLRFCKYAMASDLDNFFITLISFHVGWWQEKSERSLF